MCFFHTAVWEVNKYEDALWSRRRADFFNLNAFCINAGQKKILALQMKYR